jgi:hypothetical protein
MVLVSFPYLEAATMTEIILTGDQSQQFANATDGVVICDSGGNVIVRVPPIFTDEEVPIVAEAKRRLASDQIRSPSSDVLARLGRRESR